MGEHGEFCRSYPSFRLFGAFYEFSFKYLRYLRKKSFVLFFCSLRHAQFDDGIHGFPPLRPDSASLRNNTRFYFTQVEMHALLNVWLQCGYARQKEGFFYTILF